MGGALRPINRCDRRRATPASSHAIRRMHHLFDARLVNGPTGDPGLILDFRDQRRALLLDLGDIGVLPPRQLLRVSDVFVSHTHMDHFAGFDTMLRVVLGRQRRITLTGGPGFIAQVEHKLRAYTWNVVQRYAVGLRLDVQEIAADGRGQRAHFRSRTGFEREPDAPFDRDGDVLLDEALCRVRGRFVDHEMPCLAFVVEEKPRPRVAKDRLAALGVGTGPWLNELKLAVLSGAPAATPIRVRWRDGTGDHDRVRQVGELAAALFEVAPGRRIGYVTDLRYTEANLQALEGLVTGVDRLYIECVFLDADRAHAQRKNHLTARQAGEIARQLGARSVVPFHVSPRYGGRAGELAAELQVAWSGGSADDAVEATDGTALDDGEPPRPWTRALR
jgi:ribonuclease Z